METWQILRLGISILSLLGVIGACVAGWWAFRKVTSNHLFHIDEDLKEVKADVKENRICITSIDKSLAVIATKIGINDK